MPMDIPITVWLQIANEHANKGEGVLIARKPFPRIGMKKNQGITTLNKPNFIPSKKDAIKISYLIKIKKTKE